MENGWRKSILEELREGAKCYLIVDGCLKSSHRLLLPTFILYPTSCLTRIRHLVFHLFWKGHQTVLLLLVPLHRGLDESQSCAKATFPSRDVNLVSGCQTHFPQLHAQRELRVSINRRLRWDLEQFLENCQALKVLYQSDRGISVCSTAALYIS